MTTPSAHKPGYTAQEQQLLEEIFRELRDFTALLDWPARLPFEVGRSFVLAKLGNPVQWTLRLTQRVGKATDAVTAQLFLARRIQGTDKEKWSVAEGGFCISHGPAEKVAADIVRLSENLQPVQQQLYEDYYGTFYNP
ncbi:hypothetical protein [Hymenobacter cellulosilyticus]|uniref:Uncharacterized protein n=1 Tax=Hymenobacter cellulosilyticus TaxID=2932248 RepID=A0A8T9Q607_9BACT|nr:hypothetical protein [Hymenobacter cellulosilyticus]UOQ71851.1 hypothetical protein MUN79_25150 [Hymenobacter cellulosilyticus]